MRRAIAVLAAAVLVHAPTAAGWTWPVDGPVVRPFAFGSDPYAAGQHRGIDIGAEPGTIVHAAAAGTVSFAGHVPTAGQTVTIRTAGGLSITHVELGSVTVSRGAEVAEGDAIGSVGPVAHVHLGVRVTAEPQGYLDPLQFLPERTAAPAPPSPGGGEPRAVTAQPITVSGAGEAVRPRSEPGATAVAPPSRVDPNPAQPKAAEPQTPAEPPRPERAAVDPPAKLESPPAAARAAAVTAATSTGAEAHESMSSAATPAAEPVGADEPAAASAAPPPAGLTRRPRAGGSPRVRVVAATGPTATVARLAPTRVGGAQSRSPLIARRAAAESRSTVGTRTRAKPTEVRAAVRSGASPPLDAVPVQSSARAASEAEPGSRAGPPGLARNLFPWGLLLASAVAVSVVSARRRRDDGQPTVGVRQLGPCPIGRARPPRLIHVCVRAGPSGLPLGGACRPRSAPRLGPLPRRRARRLAIARE